MRDDDPVTLTACPDGPLIVRGPATFLDEDGEPIDQPRRTVALCRCGASAIKPWCDGTHKLTGFTTDHHDPGDATASRPSTARQ